MKLKQNNHLKGLTPKLAAFVLEYFKDFSARRAAEASGYAPDQGHTILNRDDVKLAVECIIADSYMQTGYDAEWLLHEMVDNHRIARMNGNIAASNAALKMLSTHVSIDAVAKQKVELDISSDRELFERLARGRDRMQAPIEAEAVEVQAEGKLRSIGSAPSFMSIPSQNEASLLLCEGDTGVDQETSQICAAPLKHLPDFK